MLLGPSDLVRRVIESAIGAAAGRVKGGMKDSDLKKVGDTLDEGKAGLVVVYPTNLNEQIDAVIRAKDNNVTDGVAGNRATLDKQIAADAGS